MQFSNWSPKHRIEEQYQAELSRLLDGFEKLIQGLADPYGLLELLRAYADMEFYRRFAEAAASRMVTGLQVGQMRTWKEAARESMQGRMLYQALQKELHEHVGMVMQRTIRENAQLITTFPARIAGEVNNFISREAIKGRRAAAIAKDLRTQFPKVAKARLQLIARTETSKASTALTKARSEDLGLAWYQWHTSEDQRVRPAHRKMDKVLVNWNEPPNPELLAHEKNVRHGPYQAGDIWNCRCYPAPLLDVGMLRWPAKVYHAGHIRQMTRAQFERISATERFQFVA